MAALAILVAAAGAALCLASAMANSQKLLGMGTMCLAVSALAFLLWALAKTGELRCRVRELAAGRPELDDSAFARRFFPSQPDRVATIAVVRRAIAGKFADLNGEGFWPPDRIDEDLHLRELAPAALADLPALLRRELRLPLDAWPGEEDLAWSAVADIYGTALAAEAAARVSAEKQRTTWV